MATVYWRSACLSVASAIIPVMAIAGLLVSKKSQPASSGTLPTHGPLFVGLLIGTALLVGALTFIPALALGPVAEYLLLMILSEH
ncbi:potassium-transporting ATPase subunit KdpA [Escherichia coli]